MLNPNRFLYAMIPMGLLLGSCASTQQTASVNDGVYFKPSSAPVAVAAVASAPQPTNTSNDDYYDAKTSQDLGAKRDYYDMTYNDPYYYNYGRFGFNQGLNGYQNGWNGPGWGTGMGWGMGMGIGYGFGSSFGYGSGFGGGFGSPYYGMNNYGWGPGYGYYNPWNSGGYGYGAFGNYYGGGYGNYYGPYGNYGSGYVPVTYGEPARNMSVNHRPTVGTGSGTRVDGNRPPTRNLIGLGSGYRPETGGTNGTHRVTGLDPAREHRYNDSRVIQGTRSTTTKRSTESRPSFGERNGSDFGGSRSSPSFGGGSRGGGGSSPSSPTRR